MKSLVVSLFFLGAIFTSHAVTNQELMDRLDDIELDIELARQQREFDRLMDDYTRMMTQPRPYVQPNTQGSSKSNVKKAEGNYKKLSDGEVIRWMGDKECYASWNKELKLITGPMNSNKFKEIIQLDSLIAIIYFPNNFTESSIKALLNKEGFFKLKSLCANR